MAAAAAAAEATKEKWVGFDMDECLAQLGILYYFLTELPDDSLKFIAEVLAEREKIGETWILRPAFRELIPFLATAPLTGVFIYSNNGSQRMVNFVGDIVNALAGRNLVSMRFSAKWPEERTGAALSKNLEFLQKYVSADLTKDNVLFFDDLPDHALATQLTYSNGKSNYVQVTPYKHQMDYALLTYLFEGYIAARPDLYTTLLERAKEVEAQDLKEGALLFPPDPRQVRTEHVLFRGIIQRFLGLPIMNSKTRRSAKKIARKSRKCRRHRQLRSHIL